MTHACTEERTGLNRGASRTGDREVAPLTHAVIGDSCLVLALRHDLIALVLETQQYTVSLN